MKRYPLKLSSISKTALWGGDRLHRHWHKNGGERVAESWELSVRDAEKSLVQNGLAAGLSLEEALERMGRDAVSADYAAGGRFPLLVKLIDAAEALSVQVHPDDAYAERVACELGKTEMWYILEAEEDAYIYYGLKDGVSRDDVMRAVQEGRAEDVLRRQPVLAGESYFIPSGMVHAIGRGILVAEIQQNSDLTYRLYDYGRCDADGKMRPLHIAEALEVLCPWSGQDIQSVRFARSADDGARLSDCRYFSVERWQIDRCLVAKTDSDRFSHLLCIDGEGQLSFEGKVLPIRRGDSLLLPAAMGEYRIEGCLCLLHSQP